MKTSDSRRTPRFFLVIIIMLSLVVLVGERSSIGYRIGSGNWRQHVVQKL